MTPRRLPGVFGVLVGLLLVAATLTPLPAAATSSEFAAPHDVKLVAASRSALSVSWPQVPGATRYKVSYATSKKMKGAKHKTVSSPAVELTKLKAKKTYYVTVQVVASNGKAQSPVSAKLKAKTKSKTTSATYLPPAGVKVGAAAVGSVPLSWSKRGSSLLYQVAVATTSSFSGAKDKVVKATSTTVEPLLDDTTYYLRVRVVNTKGKALSGWSSVVSGRTKPYVGNGKSATIVVASYNVGSKSITTHGTWEKRRDAVVKTVLSQRPDVIGLQEASQGKLSGKDLSQAEDLVQRLGAPYKLANTARYNCANPTSPYKCISKYTGAANSQKIVYNANKLTLLKQGSKRTASTKTRMEEYRYVEWAILRENATGKKFFFANVHLDPGTTSKLRTIRKQQMDQILAVIKQENPTKLPTYVVGDFNSHKWTEKPTKANEPYDRMAKAGYVDPLGNTYKSTFEAPGATVEKRINTAYSSFNDWKRKATKKTASDGRAWVNGIYIDYIWTTRGIQVPEWETVVNVDGNDNFKGVIPSDHNMLRATTVIR